MRFVTVMALAAALTACGQPAPEPRQADAIETTPPAMPEGAETVVFERTTETDDSEPNVATSEATQTSSDPIYWGVKDGEALTIMWEDLMPEGSEEELMQAYEEFYAMLEKRYAANTTTLADADPYGGIAEGSDLDYMPQLGTFDTVDELDGQDIRIPGYVVPFDFNLKRRHDAFLFVPYMGACIHTPPPPPNQIIFVRADPSVRIKDIWAPYWVEGTLRVETNENELGDTAYAMQLTEIEDYPTP
ncbi:MAG: DUF3299 domain-containing protein [Pseudomonadota bacterium]